MKGGAWTHRRNYISVWISSTLLLEKMSAKTTTNPAREETYGHAQEVEEQISDLMERRGDKVPEISELLDLVNNVAQKTEDPATEEERDIREDEELDDLLAQEVTPTLPNRQRIPGIQKPPVIEEEENEDDNDYEESFASQREISQLRDDFEALTERVAKYETLINVMLKERENLPVQLTSIREDINGQMTLALDKLNTALESDASPLNIQAAASAMQEVRDSSADKLQSASSFLQDKPNPASPLATSGASLKGKRRFAPIK